MHNPFSRKIVDDILAAAIIIAVFFAVAFI